MTVSVRTDTRHALAHGPHVHGIGFVDTGATSHITGDIALFDGVMTTRRTTIGGVGASAVSTGYGPAHVTIDGHSLRLDRVYYVPGLSKS